MSLIKTKLTKLKITWILSLWMAWTFCGVYASQDEPSLPSKAAIQAQLLNLPLSFESNEGQTDPKVKYLVRSQGCTMFFTPQDLVMAFSQNQSSSVLKMQFVGGDPTPEIKGLEEQRHKTNYFTENDPNQWRTNISNYKKICYREVYPGIDVVFYGNGRQLEYDICVAPNANPDQARFQIEGAEKLFVDEKGNLRILMTDQNEIQMLRPFVYQVIEGKQVTIDSHFQLLANNEVGFKLGSYQSSHLLVIDPVLGYSTYLGGTLNDSGSAIAVDSGGNVYVTGGTSSLNFPVTPGAFQTTRQGTSDAYIAKIDPTGSALIYSTYLGGTGIDNGASIKVDSGGNAYVTGLTTSSNFPTTPGAFQTTKTAPQGAFVTKLDPLGQSLVYSTYLSGATGNTSSEGIGVDNTGSAYIAGSTSSPNFPTTVGAFQPSLSGTQNSFVTKLNPTGTALVYSTYLGGTQSDATRGFGIDGAGNAYVTGSTTSSNFPTTPGAFQTVLQGTSDGFVTKLNPTGTALVYSTFLGGTGIDISRAITVDNLGNSYVTGTTLSSDFPVTPMAFQPTLLGSFNAFISKLNPTGTALVYSTYLGGSGEDNGFSIALDASNNACVAGNTTSANFPVTPDAFQSIYGGSTDAFISQINATGTGLIYSTYLGGTNTDRGSGITLDSNQNIYVVGTTSSTNFPITPGAFQVTYGGNGDAFVARFLTSTTTTLNVSPNPADFGQMVSLTATVSPSAATGTVSFFDGVALLGTVPVVGGIAVFSTDTFSVGIHTLTAEYSGDANYVGSTSSPVNLIVNLAPTQTTLTASPNPVVAGRPVTFRITVSPSIATGTISLFSGPNLLGTALVVNGTATFVITAPLRTGILPFIAIYSGDQNFSGSKSNRVFLTIEQPSVDAVLPPRHLKGLQVENRFATQSDIVNVLKWKAPSFGRRPVAYRIYGGSLDHLIAVVDASQSLVYEDHNRKKGKIYLYYVISEDEFGNFSEPESISIK